MTEWTKRQVHKIVFVLLHNFVSFLLSMNVSFVSSWIRNIIVIMITYKRKHFRALKEYQSWPIYILYEQIILNAENWKEL